jgi:protoporphyrinogen oxidase
MFQEDGFIWEEGANSFQPNQVIMSVARDLGLLSELVLANSNLPRYIYWNNTLHSLPVSLKQLWQSKLLSLRGKVAFVLGALGLVGQEDGWAGEESIQAFATRHFGTLEIIHLFLLYHCQCSIAYLWFMLNDSPAGAAGWVQAVRYFHG